MLGTFYIDISQYPFDGDLNFASYSFTVLTRKSTHWAQRISANNPRGYNEEQLQKIADAPTLAEKQRVEMKLLHGRLSTEKDILNPPNDGYGVDYILATIVEVKAEYAAREGNPSVPGDDDDGDDGVSADEDHFNDDDRDNDSDNDGSSLPTTTRYANAHCGYSLVFCFNTMEKNLFKLFPLVLTACHACLRACQYTGASSYLTTTPADTHRSSCIGLLVQTLSLQSGALS
jgi:hypothetical protein